MAARAKKSWVPKLGVKGWIGVVAGGAALVGLAGVALYSWTYAGSYTYKGVKVTYERKSQTEWHGAAKMKIGAMPIAVNETSSSRQGMQWAVEAEIDRVLEAGGEPDNGG